MQCHEFTTQHGRHRVTTRTAKISSCEQYRYWLCRDWTGAPTAEEKRVAWLMLNPSTAAVRFPFRIIRTDRLRAVEALETRHDLHFMRDVLERSIEEVETMLGELVRSHTRPDGDIDSDGVREEIEYLRALRIDLKACLCRIGGRV